MATFCSKEFTILVGQLGLEALANRAFCKGIEIIEGECGAALVTGPEAVPPYTWTIESGEAALNAAGLTIDVGIEPLPGLEAFQILGTPTLSGPITFSVRVEDEAVPQNVALSSYTIHIGEIVEAAGALPPAAIGQPYSTSLTQSGVPAPATWAVSSGLAAFTAAGLSLNPNTGEITGTPNTTGTIAFTVTISSANA